MGLQPMLQWLGFLNIDFSDASILIEAAQKTQPFGFHEVVRFTDVNGTIPDLTGATLGSDPPGLRPGRSGPAPAARHFPRLNSGNLFDSAEAR